MNIKTAVKTAIVTISLLGGVTLVQSTSTTAHADAVSEYWSVTDSLGMGFTGNSNATSYTEVAASDLGAYLNRYHSQSGASIQNNFSTFVDQLDSDKFHRRAKYLVVEMGVNDVNYGSSNINDVVETFRSKMGDLIYNNPQASPYVVFGPGTWLNGNNNTIHQGGYSYNQLKQAMKSVLNDIGVKYYDSSVVVNDSNHSWKLGDGTVHPTQATYATIGHNVANFIKANPGRHIRYTPYTINRLHRTGYVNTLVAGWRWLEGGRAYTGMRNYMGAYYYFDKGVRQENKFVHQWGLTYYVGADGRTVQGWHTINGKAYNFGNNGTFYAR